MIHLDDLKNIEKRLKEDYEFDSQLYNMELVKKLNIFGLGLLDLNSVLTPQIMRFIRREKTLLQKTKFKDGNDALFMRHEFKGLPLRYISDTRVDITNQRKYKIDHSLYKDCKELGFIPQYIQDIEFFEFELPEKSLQQDPKKEHLLVEINNDRSLSDKEKKEMIKEFDIFWDKDKIHLQYLVGDFQGKNRFVPVYIGIGNNEPFGLRDKLYKKRFYKMDLIDNLMIEKGILQTVKNSELLNSLGKKQYETYFIEESLRNNEGIYIVYAPEENYVLKGFLRGKYDGDIYNPKFTNEVVPKYDCKKLNRKKEISDMLHSGWSNREDLFNLLNMASIEHDTFYYAYNETDKIVRDLGSESIEKHIKKYGRLDVTHRKSTAEDLADDLFVLGKPNRMKANLFIAGMMAKLGTLDKIILS